MRSICWFTGEPNCKVEDGLSIQEMYWESLNVIESSRFSYISQQQLINANRVYINPKSAEQLLLPTELNNLGLLSADQRDRRIDEAWGTFCTNDAIDPEPSEAWWSNSRRRPRCWFSKVACDPDELLWSMPLSDLHDLGVRFEGNIVYNRGCAEYFLKNYGGGESSSLSSSSSCIRDLSRLFSVSEEVIASHNYLNIRACIWKVELQHLYSTRVA